MTLNMRRIFLIPDHEACTYGESFRISQCDVTFIPPIALPMRVLPILAIFNFPH